MMSLFEGFKSQNERDDKSKEPCKFTASVFRNSFDISWNKLADRLSGTKNNRAMLRVFKWWVGEEKRNEDGWSSQRATRRKW